MNFQKRRIQLSLIAVGIIALAITADKCRQLVGKESSSKSGQFTILNCLDGGSGTLACVVKEGVKLYFCNIRASHVERARHKAVEEALVDALSQGLVAKEAAKQAQKEGAKAAKLATRQAKRIIGPIIASGWDFFEAIYYGGTLTEGFLRGTGTLFGTYIIGFHGEQRFGRFGYLVGSELGSWVGGRIGLMVYDVVNGVHYLLTDHPLEEETKVYETPPPLESSHDAVANFFKSLFGSSQSEEETKAYLTPLESSLTAVANFFKSFSGSSQSEEETSNFYEAQNSQGEEEASYVSENPTYTTSSSEPPSEDNNIDEVPSFWGSEANKDL